MLALAWISNARLSTDKLPRIQLFDLRPVNAYIPVPSTIPPRSLSHCTECPATRPHYGPPRTCPNHPISPKLILKRRTCLSYPPVPRNLRRLLRNPIPHPSPINCIHVAIVTNLSFSLFPILSRAHDEPCASSVLFIHLSLSLSLSLYYYSLVLFQFSFPPAEIFTPSFSS